MTRTGSSNLTMRKPACVDWLATTGVRRNFSRGATSTFCLSFSGCWRRNANRRSQDALPFLHHKENAPCYGRSPKWSASLAAVLLTQYKTTWLTTISSHCLAALPSTDVCVQQLHTTNIYPAAKVHCFKEHPIHQRRYSSIHENKPRRNKNVSAQF